MSDAATEIKVPVVPAELEGIQRWNNSQTNWRTSCPIIDRHIYWVARISSRKQGCAEYDFSRITNAPQQILRSEEGVSKTIFEGLTER